MVSGKYWPKLLPALLHWVSIFRVVDCNENAANHLSEWRSECARARAESGNPEEHP